MSNKGIPSLGPSGYMTVRDNPSELMQTIFSHTLESDYSQSTFFAGKVTSLQWIIKEFNHVPEQLAIELKKKLSEVYGKFFDEIKVECYTDNSDTGQYNINISITAYFEGSELQLGREILINTEEGTGKIIKSING